MKISPVFTVFIGLSLVTGVVYPLIVTAVARIAFPQESSGSLILRDGKLVGSELIGQFFSAQDLFWPRPSAAGAFPYNGASGAGSNLAPSNPAYLARVSTEVDRLAAAHEGRLPVPVDLVTTSGSGLDPHISEAAAEYQIDRVAKARGVPRERIARLVQRYTQQPTVGIFGHSRVNVLLLNLALREEFAK
jgi:K+-transporting ATPase ATPase C chain